jgi:drug/metabolite transporter (DMT)-like permease
LKPADLTILIAVGAIWGAAFPLLRVGSPEFGPFALIFVRLLAASIVLLPFVNVRQELIKHWRALALLGLVNTAVPFTLFSYATLSISAGLASLLNATTPMFGALAAYFWLGERLTISRSLGIALGFVGVALIVGGEVGIGAGQAVLGVAAGLFGAALYGLAANYVKRSMAGISPAAIAAGCIVSSTFMLAPLALWFWPSHAPTAAAWASAVTLGVLCTATAYFLYFKLLARVTVSSAVAVTFLIPVFGILWGALFLGETITPALLASSGVVLLGTALATGVIRIALGARRADG